EAAGSTTPSEAEAEGTTEAEGEGSTTPAEEEEKETSEAEGSTGEGSSTPAEEEEKETLEAEGSTESEAEGSTTPSEAEAEGTTEAESEGSSTPAEEEEKESSEADTEGTTESTVEDALSTTEELQETAPSESTEEASTETEEETPEDLETTTAMPFKECLNYTPPPPALRNLFNMLKPHLNERSRSQRADRKKYPSYRKLVKEISKTSVASGSFKTKVESIISRFHGSINESVESQMHFFEATRVRMLFDLKNFVQKLFNGFTDLVSRSLR
ncbi:neuromodulin-like, partial [Anopheles bellator]|uniref:neuromodulin-like n=1 Tax=Anopheles bellator TaxID=139047 RepID=UPI00264785A5